MNLGKAPQEDAEGARKYFCVDTELLGFSPRRAPEVRMARRT